MAEITHDPTRGWLLLTPDGQIEIERKDWDEVIEAIPDDQLCLMGDPIQDHHPYSVDAEFEVKEDDPCKGGFYPVCADGCWGSKTGCVRKRQIARLVKAKEVDPYAQNKKQLDDLKVILENKIKETESDYHGYTKGLSRICFLIPFYYLSPDASKEH